MTAPIVRPIPDGFIARCASDGDLNAGFRRLITGQLWTRAEVNR